MQVQILPLNSRHHLKDFDCGSLVLNQWFTTTAKQQGKRVITRTFVCEDCSAPETVLGYYALAVSEVSNEILAKAKKFPRRVPVVRLCRLAVDLRWQGHGLGQTLLLNALGRVADISQSVGVAAMVVDAKDILAASFYESYGFYPAPDNPLQLVLPMETLLVAIGSS